MAYYRSLTHPAAALAAVYASNGDSITINIQIGIVINVQTNRRKPRLERCVVALADRLSVTILINWPEYDEKTSVLPDSGLVSDLEK